MRSGADGALGTEAVIESKPGGFGPESLVDQHHIAMG